MSQQKHWCLECIKVLGWTYLSLAFYRTPECHHHIAELKLADSVDIKPKHWWTYLNPFWYRRRRLMRQWLKVMINDSKLDEQFQKAVNDAVLYGQGSLLMKDGSAAHIQFGDIWKS